MFIGLETTHCRDRDNTKLVLRGCARLQIENGPFCLTLSCIDEKASGTFIIEGTDGLPLEIRWSNR